jgi:hypothetical protein
MLKISLDPYSFSLSLVTTFKQCCGAGTWMHYGSGSGFGSWANVKCNKTVKKLKMRDQVLRICCFLTSGKGKILCNSFVFGKLSGSGTRTKPFSKSGTGTATNHYGSTTIKSWNIIRKNNLPGNHRDTLLVNAETCKQSLRIFSA